MSSFRGLVRRMAKNPTPDAMTAVAAAASVGLRDDEIVTLALTLADSGDRFTPDGPAADVSSTGGPSSLSTILAPLLLAEAGALAVKLGVPGRPAGGLDVMANIPGFKPVLDEASVRRALAESRVAHFAAADRWTPLDGRFFAHRKSMNAVGVPDLVIASLLSKKLAVGLTSATVEVRVAPHGNFGRTRREALANARRFVDVGALAGVSVACCLTDAASPYQRRIGRGEALEALALIVGDDALPADLATHLKLCVRLASEALDGSDVSLDRSRLRSRLAAHLSAQGACLDGFLRRVAEHGGQSTCTIRAARSGFLRVDLGGIRRALVATQRAAVCPTTPYPDPAGVTLLADSGDEVLSGQPLATVRTADAVPMGPILEAIRSHVDARGEPGSASPRLLGVVRHDDPGEESR